MRTALITFDSQQFNLIFNKMLQDLGFLVLSTSNFDEAIDLCNLKKPDVLFLDWKLENKPITELLSKLVYRPCIVFVSSQAAPQTLQEALDLGADEYIIKPFDNDILKSKLSLAGVL